MKIAIPRLTPLLLCLVSSASRVHAGEAEFLELQQKLEADILEFRRMTEKAYQSRCDAEGLLTCTQGNFNACQSSFPNAVCPTGEEFQLDACADGCSSLRDYTISIIQFPLSSANRVDLAVMEDVCFTKALDSYFVSKYATDGGYWSQWGIVSMFFGSVNGAFRMFPALANETCNEYDARLRPWYVAGSSGPKNVVLILDTSGSMDGLRLNYLKQAAARIVDTLTVGDRIALISFSNIAHDTSIDGRFMVKVTSDIKRILKDRIDDLEAVGSTNIYDAFRRTFEILEEAIPLELVVDCNTAILFLTDGKMTDPPNMTEGMVLNFVQAGLATLEERLSHPVHLFSYSISENDDVHSFPKELACAATTHGVWSKVVDDYSIIDSLTSYSQLFSMGLGDGKNEDFTAWVEPYSFSTNGQEGVTVSAPVFDRSVDPPIFIGVVGMDLLMKALDRALGVEFGSSETLDRVVQSSTAKCPKLESTACQLESFRSLGSVGEEGRCGIPSCTNTSISLEARTCRNQDDIPTAKNVLANQDHELLAFVERACCSSETSTNSTSAPRSFLSGANGDTFCIEALLAKQAATSGGGGNLKIGWFVGASIIIVGLCALFCAWWISRIHRQSPPTPSQDNNNSLPVAYVSPPTPSQDNNNSLPVAYVTAVPLDPIPDRVPATNPEASANPLQPTILDGIGRRKKRGLRDYGTDC